MTLPDLAVQIVYARLGWGMVCAALLVAALRRHSIGKRWQAGLMAVLAFAVMWLPGPVSPAYWLGLVFQFPSAALVAVCAVSVSRPGLPARPAPTSWRIGAIVLAAGGAMLYLDSAGWTSLELYALGADPRLAPLVALVLGMVGLGALRAASTRPTGLVLLASVVAFCVFRLPSGNLFDALLDPLLWFGSLGLTVGVAWRHLRRSGIPARPSAA